MKHNYYVLMFVFIISCACLYSQDLLIEKVIEKDSNYNISMINKYIQLKDNNLLIVLTMQKMTDFSKFLSLLKIDTKGGRIWQTYIEWPHELYPVDVYEEDNNNISILCNMCKYYSKCEDYTPALIHCDNLGRLLDITVDTLSTIGKKNEEAGVTLFNKDKYVNFSICKNALIVKEYDLSLKFSKDIILDSNISSDTFKFLQGITGSDSRIILGGFCLSSNNTPVNGTFMRSYDKDYNNEWEILDSNRDELHSFRYIFNDDNDGFNLIQWIIPDYNTYLGRRTVIKHYTKESNTDQTIEFTPPYDATMRNYIKLENGGYTFIVDSMKGMSKFNPGVIRIDGKGNILWHRTWGNETLYNIIQKGIYQSPGNYYFIGFMGSQVYYVHLRDNTLGVEDNIESPEPAFTVSPNPASESITVAFNTELPGNITITLYDIGGRALKTLFEGVHPAGGSALELQLPKLHPGCFNVVVTDGSGKRHSEKLMVK